MGYGLYAFSFIRVNIGTRLIVSIQAVRYPDEAIQPHRHPLSHHNRIKTTYKTLTNDC